LNEVAEENNVAVFNIPGNLLVSDGVRVRVKNPEYMDNIDMMVLNFGGKNVYLDYLSLEEVKNHSTKILINCYEAEYVRVSSSAVYGSILAPFAKLKGHEGSVIFGSVFAKSLESVDLQLFEEPWFGLNRGGMCVQCADDYWGLYCQSCNCSYNEDCDDTVTGTGVCTCKPGWNDECSECDTAHYGYLCEENCTDTCVLHGVCSSGQFGNGSCAHCDENVHGDQCQFCTAGRYGPYCENECSDSCLSNGVCNEGMTGNGSCACKEGWAGAQCDICDDGHFGLTCEGACVESCVINGECSHGFYGTGECLSCRDTFIGENCEFCGQNNTWGDECQFSCNTTCLDRGTCDDGPFGSGLCLNCEGNYGGDQCETCAAGYYGENCTEICADSCLDHGYCSNEIQSGGCLACFRGYQLDSGECLWNEEFSAAGTYGLSLLVLLLIVQTWLF